MHQLKIIGSYTLLCISCLTIMVGALVAPGLIKISTALGVSDNAILLVTLPALGAIIFAPIAGKLIDRYGAYKSVIAGLFLYGFLGVSVYWLYGPMLVFTNRVLLGGVTALVMAGSTVLISQWYFAKARLDMIAKQGMAIELGGVIFLSLGGLFASWHWALPLSLYLVSWIFLVMLLLFIPKRHPNELQTNAPKQAILDNKTLSLNSIYAIAVLSMIAFFTSIILLPISMHEKNYNEEQVGFLLAFISLIAVVTANFMPKLTRIFREKKVLVLAFIAYSASFFCFLQQGAALLVIGAVFSGIGFGLSVPLLNHMTVELSDIKVRGRNLSFFTMAIFSGQFLTSFVEYIPGGITNVFISGVIFCLLVVMTLSASVLGFQQKQRQ